MSAAGLGGGEKEKPKPAPGPVTVAVDFEEVTADGGPVDGVDVYPTKALTLHFSAGIAGLSADHITLTFPDGANITKVALEGKGPSYTLYVSDVAADGEVGVRVNKAGYVFTPPTKTVTVLDASKPATQPAPAVAPVSSLRRFRRTAEADTRQRP